MDNDSLLKELLKMNPHLGEGRVKSSKAKKLHGTIISTFQKPKSEIVFDKIKYKDESYYRDSAGGLWDKDCKLVGTSYKNSSGEYEYRLFEEDAKITDKKLEDFLT